MKSPVIASVVLAGNNVPHTRFGITGSEVHMYCALGEHSRNRIALGIETVQYFNSSTVRCVS